MVAFESLSTCAEFPLTGGKPLIDVASEKPGSTPTASAALWMYGTAPAAMGRFGPPGLPASLSGRTSPSIRYANAPTYGNALMNRIHAIREAGSRRGRNSTLTERPTMMRRWTISHMHVPCLRGLQRDAGASGTT